MVPRSYVIYLSRVSLAQWEAEKIPVWLQPTLIILKEGQEEPLSLSADNSLFGLCLVQPLCFCLVLE